MARLSTEAKYRALASTTAEMTWITYLLQDIRLPMTQNPLLLGDYMSALHLTKNPLFHARTKHIEIDYHFVREKVAQGSLDIRHVPSHQQIADVFTKPLSKQPFLTLRHKLGVHCVDLPSLRGVDNNEPIW